MIRMAVARVLVGDTWKFLCGPCWSAMKEATGESLVAHTINRRGGRSCDNCSTRNLLSMITKKEVARG